MGYIHSTHIQAFVQGQVIKQLSADNRGHTWLELGTGEKLRMYPDVEHGKSVIIATPFRADGEVKQSTQIMAEAGKPNETPT